MLKIISEPKKAIKSAYSIGVFLLRQRQVISGHIFLYRSGGLEMKENIISMAKTRRSAEFHAGYEALDPRFTIIRAVINARKKADLTQKKLADKTGITQSNISRIETGEGNPSLKTLKRLASGLHMKLNIEFSPIVDPK